MQLQQKEAAITLASGIIFALLPLAAKPLQGELSSETILVALVIFIQTLWIGRIVIGARFKALDERDKTIRYQAAMIAMHFFGAVVMVFACVLYLNYRDILLVPLHLVILLAYYSWISLYVSWSAAMLILHKTGTLNV